MIADEILKKVEFDAIYLVYNKFQSVVQFLPTVATILSPEVNTPKQSRTFLVKLIKSLQICPCKKIFHVIVIIYMCHDLQVMATYFVCYHYFSYSLTKYRCIARHHFVYL
jgi:F0F1-type ATP synthase gamma subunit